MRVSEANPWEHLEETPVMLEEDHPLSRDPNVDHFSDQVRESERVVMQAHRDGHYVATHFRYPIVYGPRQIGPPEWCIIRRVRDGRKQVILPGGGMALMLRGCSQNIAHGILLAVDNPKASAGQIYNIRDERVLYNREWLRLVAGIMKHEFEFVEIPFDFLPPGFRSAPTQTLYRYHEVPDITKIKQQLGYRDVVPVEKALELTVQWYLDNPVPPGGEAEQNIGDPFDYAYEDELIRIFKSGSETMRQQLAAVPSPKVTWRHPFPHPKKRGDLR
ncbi:MAG: hypothetical protein NTU41_01175 [Chloroflexi bacterium]|nr:hypothetical protein [Chloroflexota bacterium]